MNRLQRWVTLGAMENWGPVRARQFVEAAGSLDRAWAKIRRHHAGFQSAYQKANSALDMQEKEGYWAISWEDPSYPRRWRTWRDAPLAIFGRGEKASWNHRKFVAIVGTRKCCEASARISFQTSQTLSQSGIGIASGLALGIDAAAHRGSLYNQGTTLACLGHGLDRMYPKRHQGLANAMVSNGGTLLTEHLMGTGPARWHFASRNRLVVGLSEAVVLIQSPAKGGAMISAELAVESGVDLWVYRPPDYAARWAGNWALLEAYPEAAWSHPEQLMQRLGVFSKRAIADDEEALQKELRPLWRALIGTSGCQVEELARVLNESMEAIQGKLFMLELQGKVERLSGGWFVPLISAWGHRA